MNLHDPVLFDKLDFCLIELVVLIRQRQKSQFFKFTGLIIKDYDLEEQELKHTKHLKDYMELVISQLTRLGLSEVVMHLLGSKWSSNDLFDKSLEASTISRVSIIQSIYLKYAL